MSHWQPSSDFSRTALSRQNRNLIRNFSFQVFRLSPKGVFLQLDPVPFTLAWGIRRRITRNQPSLPSSGTPPLSPDLRCASCPRSVMTISNLPPNYAPPALRGSVCFPQRLPPAAPLFIVGTRIFGRGFSYDAKLKALQRYGTAPLTLITTHTYSPSAYAVSDGDRP